MVTERRRRMTNMGLSSPTGFQESLGVIGRKRRETTTRLR